MSTTSYPSIPAVYEYVPPPARDRLPTLPEDLSEYAWANTGPESWSAINAGLVADDEQEEDEEEEEIELSDDDFVFEGTITTRRLDELSVSVLLDLWSDDIVRLVPQQEHVIDERDACIVSLIDGQRSVTDIIGVARLDPADVLGALCELCANGVITLDRSRRTAAAVIERSTQRSSPSCSG